MAMLILSNDSSLAVDQFINTYESELKVREISEEAALAVAEQTWVFLTNR